VTDHVHVCHWQSPESAEVLHQEKTGWFGEVGRADLMEVANAAAKTSFKFEEMYMCDPKAKHHGFKSWDGTLNSHSPSYY
jgi:phosphatidylserine decarboxylase